MIIVHDIFICKPGNATKLAKMFKEAMADSEELVHIMSDMSRDSTDNRRNFQRQGSGLHLSMVNILKNYQTWYISLEPVRYIS